MERYSEPLSLAHNNSVVITSNKEKTKKLAQLSTQFEYEKKEESLRLMQKQETALLNSEIKEQKATQLATLIGLGLTLLLIVVLIIFYRSKQKSNGQLNQANAELSNYVEELTTVNENLNVAHEELTTVNESLNTTLHTVEKQRDNIMGSINYAQRIQNAILPIPERLNSALKEYFILFKPRDVVSGDFYWFDEIDNKQFIAVADCTGHGVPGAFMTMLGTQALTDIIVQKGIHKPNEILLELDKTLYKLLKSDSSRLVDGMDIVICVIDKIAKTLTFAGAKNPIILIHDNELHEIKGDKISINGPRKSRENIQYQNHNVEFTPSTMLYMYSDGFQDQFGGEDNRKFMKKRWKKLLLEISHLPISTQKEHLENTLKDWMQKNTQVDDILVMGIKL